MATPKSETQKIGDALIEQGWVAEEGDEPGEVIFHPPPDERF